MDLYFYIMLILIFYIYFIGYYIGIKIKLIIMIYALLGTGRGNYFPLIIKLFLKVLIP